MYQYFFKRGIDIILAIIGLLFLLPIILVLALLLAFYNKGPAFFRQERPGKHGKIFKILKFKTMTDERDTNGELLPDFKRITKIGRFVRKYSLDEIPQLFSVLKGDMSIVGPRPLLVKYLPLYSDEQARRHDVKPGITGWAQVNGRNAINWQEKFRLDVYYVDNLSLKLDFEIFIKTVLKVFKSEGINNDETDTMPSFTGNPD